MEIKASIKCNICHFLMWYPSKDFPDCFECEMCANIKPISSKTKRKIHQELNKKKEKENVK